MLVLTRKTNQNIMIGDDIEVSVLSIMGGKVRIGVQAPQNVPVLRKELYVDREREARVVPVSLVGSSAAGSPGPSARP
jgi:carbon storage regulator